MQAIDDRVFLFMCVYKKRKRRMGNTESTTASTQQSIDEFTSAFVSAELSDKHTRLVESASELLRLSDVPFSIERLDNDKGYEDAENIMLIYRPLNIELTCSDHQDEAHLKWSRDFFTKYGKDIFAGALTVS